MARPRRRQAREDEEEEEEAEEEEEKNEDEEVADEEEEEEKEEEEEEEEAEREPEDEEERVPSSGGSISRNDDDHDDDYYLPEIGGWRDESSDEDGEAGGDADGEDDGGFADACREGRHPRAIRAIVRRRLREDPNFLARTLPRSPDGRRKLPLHVAIECGAPFEVIRHLVELSPSTVRRRMGSLREIALHLAMIHDLPDDVIDFLLEAWPDSAKVRSKNGSCALHHALDRRVPLRLDTLRRLIGAWPDALRVRDAARSLPLHVLLDRIAGGPVAADSVAALVEPFPEALEERKKDGSLPLHAAAGNREVPLGVLRYLVGLRPRTLHSWMRGFNHEGQRVRKGHLPLHLALEAGGPPPERTRFFLEQWPESIRERDGSGCLPAHLATDFEVPPETLQFVVQWWPESVKERDNRGRLPVHLAAIVPSLVKIRFLVEAWPESVDEVDAEGETPLHWALRCLSASDPPGGEISYLVARSINALGVADDRGRLPLHVAAAKFQVALPLVRAVLEGRPCAARAADSDGDLPLHAALAKRRPLAVVRYLVEQNPDALRHRNNAGLLPVQVAFSGHGEAMDVIRYLIQQRPESVQDRDAAGRALLHFVADLAPRLAPAGVDQYLVEQWPEALQVRDSRGLLPLHVAASAKDSTLDLVYRLARRRPDLLLYDGLRGGRRLPARGRDPCPVRAGASRGGPSRRANKRARA